jgi:hypothetical protein
VWHEIGQLCIDEDGCLWEWVDRPGRGRSGWLYHGLVADLDVPPDLAGAAAELLDHRLDAHRR